jgi:hypothetical protein
MPRWVRAAAEIRSTAGPPTLSRVSEPSGVVVEFVRDAVVLEVRTYNDIDQIPEVVTIAGRALSTVGSDPDGRQAWHRRYAYRDDGQVVYTLNVVDV